MTNRLVTLELDPARANLASVRERYQLAEADADPQFGVVCVSPDRNLYAILATDSAARRIEAEPGVAGVYANPKIEPFGPPERA